MGHIISLNNITLFRNIIFVGGIDLFIDLYTKQQQQHHLYQDKMFHYSECNKSWET